MRSYEDYLLLLGNDVFGVLSVVFGLVYLLRPRDGRARPVTGLFAILGILLQLAYVLFYLKARMILLTTAITMALASEVASRRRAERLLQTILVLLPALSLLGVQVTLLIGRFNVPEDRAPAVSEWSAGHDDSAAAADRTVHRGQPGGRRVGDSGRATTCSAACSAWRRG